MKNLVDKLNECGFDGRISYKNEMTLQWCPFHDHCFRTPSLSINVEKKKFTCFACGAGGHVRKLLYHFGISYGGWQQIGEQDFNPTMDKLIFGFDEFQLQEDEVNKADVNELKNYRYFHPYLVNRGFTKEIILKNKIGFDKVNASVTIPIFFEKEYYGCIKRAAWDSKIKYLYPENLQKAAILYQPKPVQLLDDSIEFIVEGSLDALKVCQFGYFASSILGCMVSKPQIKKIAQSKRKKILALDNDEAGRKGIKRFIEMYPDLDLEILTLPAGIKDVGELNKDIFQECLTNCKDGFSSLAYGW